jgi:Cdc6-like AAA superfamily ATPase
MPNLGFKNSKGAIPIAIVKGGDYDSEVLFLNENDNIKHKNKNKEIPAIKYVNDLKKLKPQQRIMVMNRLQTAFENGIPPEMLMESDEIKSLYSKIQDDDKKDTSIHLPDDSSFQIIPSPDPEKRAVYYIAGQSGSGKSYMARMIAENYKKIHPEREIYLISKLNEDSTLDTMKIGKPKRINPQSILDDYPKIEEFKDCMIIFDDYDTFDGKLGIAIQKLIDDLAIQGRHTNTTLLCLTHYITNYKKTRLILNEASHFVVYPQATSFSALKYLLGTHLGMEKQDVQNLKKLGRWVCISKNYPQYIISEHFSKLLNQE